MDSSTNEDIKTTCPRSIPLKRLWPVGKNIVVVIDNAIVERLGINAENVYVEEEVTNEGILLRIK